MTEIIRQGTQRMSAWAIQQEVNAWLEQRAELRDAAGRQQVIRNEHLSGRTITTGVGVVEIRQPRVRNRRSADGDEQIVRLGDLCNLCGLVTRLPAGGLLMHHYLYPPSSLKITS
ncbi:MAG: hypothetical protein JW959_00275 [Pirellulales bacterium]|nr:hypothetical protein [Pirellulales bacterium]